MEGFAPVLKRAAGAVRAALPALALLGLWAGTLPEASAAKRKKAPQSYAVIAGTVFEENGRSVPGARIVVTPLAPEGEKPVTGRAEGTSDSRGEFAVRVPSGSMRYNVRVEARGFEPAEKQVQVEWDQRLDIVFRLQPLGEGGKQR
jgi:hypothetical protein